MVFQRIILKVSFSVQQKTIKLNALLQSTLRGKVNKSFKMVFLFESANYTFVAYKFNQFNFSFSKQVLQSSL